MWMIVVLVRSHGAVTEAFVHFMFSLMDQPVIFRDEKSVQAGVSVQCGSHEEKP